VESLKEGEIGDIRGVTEKGLGEYFGKSYVLCDEEKIRRRTRGGEQ